MNASGYVIEQTEYPAGPDHVIVVRQPPGLTVQSWTGRHAGRSNDG
jgi:hypothetical protein